MLSIAEDKQELEEAIKIKRPRIPNQRHIEETEINPTSATNCPSVESKKIKTE